MIFIAYLLLGVFAGVLAGLFGIGGGAVLVPAFIFFFNVQGIAPDVLTYMAIASSLGCIIFSASSATWTHHKNQAVQWTFFRSLLPGICIGSWLGVSTVVNISQVILQFIIGLFLIFLGYKMYRNIKLFKVQSDQQTNGAKLAIAGGIIGWVSAIFGIGGGTLTVPFLQYCRLSIQQAVATSAACGLPIAVVGVVSNIYVAWDNPSLPAWSLGYIYLPAVFCVVCSSIPSASLGAKLAHRLEAATLKRYFAIFLMLVGVWTMSHYFNT